jgi:hypothetical protein
VGIDSGVLAGRISIIADALPKIISMPLFGLRADSCSGRPADDCAGSRTARSARQNAAENAADDSASHCAADSPLAWRRRRRGRTRRRIFAAARRQRCIFAAGRRRRDLFDGRICIFDI